MAAAPLACLGAERGRGPSPVVEIPSASAAAVEASVALSAPSTASSSDAAPSASAAPLASAPVSSSGVLVPKTPAECKALLARARAAANAVVVKYAGCVRDADCVVVRGAACVAAGCGTGILATGEAEYERMAGQNQASYCGPFYAGDCMRQLPPMPIPTCAPQRPVCVNGRCEARP